MAKIRPIEEYIFRLYNQNSIVIPGHKKTYFSDRILSMCGLSVCCPFSNFVKQPNNYTTATYSRPVLNNDQAQIAYQTEYHTAIIHKFSTIFMKFIKLLYCFQIAI